MGSSSWEKDIAFLERSGRFMGLVPIRKRSSNSEPTFHIPLLISSVVLFVLQTLWDFDDLKLSNLKRNSEKISYLVFEMAIWLSSSVGRLAFLTSAHNCNSFLTHIKAYVNEFVPAETNKRKKRFKIVCLVCLNFLYFFLIAESIWRLFFKPKNTGSDFEDQCGHKYLFPCNSGWIYSALLVCIDISHGATLYYLTYFAIVISDILLHILTSFENNVLEKLEPESASLVKDPAFFILRQSGHTKKGLKSNPKIQNNLHDQFSKIRNLFESFNCSIGAPLLVTCFSDILMFICLVFALIPNFVKNKDNQMTTFALGSGFPIDQSYVTDNYIESDIPSYGIDPESNTSLYNETSEYNISSGSAAGAPGNGYIPFPTENAINEGAFSNGFYFVIATLFECRAVLLAVIGSVLKFKIDKVKVTLDNKVHGASSLHRSRSDLYTLNENNDKTIAAEVLGRFQQWHWELRLMDMVTINLGLIPTMLGTVMTYVVVLLQIRLSEE